MSKLESAEENVALTSKGLQSILNFASKIDKEQETKGTPRLDSATNNNAAESHQHKSDPVGSLDKDRY